MADRLWVGHMYRRQTPDKALTVAVHTFGHAQLVGPFPSLIRLGLQTQVTADMADLVILVNRSRNVIVYLLQCAFVLKLQSIHLQVGVDYPTGSVRPPKRL